MTVTREMTNEEMRDRIVLLEVLNRSQQESIDLMKERETVLIALEATGVDNWQGYSDAMVLAKEMEQG